MPLLSSTQTQSANGVPLYVLAYGGEPAGVVPPPVIPPGPTGPGPQPPLPVPPAPIPEPESKVDGDFEVTGSVLVGSPPASGSPLVGSGQLQLSSVPGTGASPQDRYQVLEGTRAVALGRTDFMWLAPTSNGGGIEIISSGNDAVSLANTRVDVVGDLSPAGAMGSPGRFAGNGLGFYSSGSVALISAVANGVTFPVTPLNTFLANQLGPAIVRVTIWAPGGTSAAGVPWGTVQFDTPGRGSTAAITTSDNNTDGFSPFQVNGNQNAGNLVISIQNASGSVMPTVLVSFTCL